MHRRHCLPIAILLLAIIAVFTTAVHAQVPRYCILRRPIPAFGGAPCYEFFLADCTNTGPTKMCSGDAATATATAYATSQGWAVDPNAHPPGVGLFVNWEAADSFMNFLSPYGKDFYGCFPDSPPVTLPPRIPLGPQTTVGALGPGGTKYVILRKPEFAGRPNCYEFYLVDVTGANARAYIDASGTAWVTGIGAREGWEVDPTLGGPYVNWEAADSSMSKLSRYGGNLYCCGCTPIPTATPRPTAPPARTPRPRPTRPAPGSAPTAPPPPPTIPPTAPPTPPPTVPPTPPPTVPPTPPPTIPPTPPPTVPPTPPPTIAPTPPPTIPPTPPPTTPLPPATITPAPPPAGPTPAGGPTPQVGWLTSTPPIPAATPIPATPPPTTPIPATPEPPSATPPSNENPFAEPGSQGYIDDVTNNEQNRTDNVVTQGNTDGDSVIARGPRTYTQGTLVSSIRSTIQWVRTTPPPPATPVPTAKAGPTAAPAKTPPPATPPQPAKTPFQPSSGLTNVTVSKRTITVTFWDHGTEDGDIIDITLNGQVLRGGIVLTKAPQSMTIEINDSSAVFGVRAVNEGSISPNTASVQFSDVTTGKPVQVYSIKSGQKADMSITYGGQ